MRAHGDLDQRITGRGATDAGRAFGAQSQYLSVARPDRDRYFELAAIGQGDLLFATVDGVKEIELEPIKRILPGPSESAATAASKDLGQDLVGPGHIGKSVGAGITILRTASVFAVKAARRSFGAGGIDFAAIVARALFRVADQIIGSRDRLELLFALLIAWIEIGMQLLRQRPIGLADVLL